MGILEGKRGAEDRHAALRSLSLFANCTRKQLQFVDSMTDQVTAPAGDVLIREGKLNHTFFLILKGEVEVSRAGQPVAVLEPGDFFGEISMVDLGTATATATATEDSIFMVMSHQQFRDAISADHEIISAVLKKMAERMPGAGVTA